MTTCQIMSDDVRPKALVGPEWVTRTLLFADVVESVRLMEQDESDVVRRWRSLVGVVEKEILPPNHGRDPPGCRAPSPS